MTACFAFLQYRKKRSHQLFDVEMFERICRRRVLINDQLVLESVELRVEPPDQLLGPLELVAQLELLCLEAFELSLLVNRDLILKRSRVDWCRHRLVAENAAWVEKRAL